MDECDVDEEKDSLGADNLNRPRNIMSPSLPGTLNFTQSNSSDGLSATPLSIMAGSIALALAVLVVSPTKVTAKEFWTASPADPNSILFTAYTIGNGHQAGMLISTVHHPRSFQD